VNYIINPSWQYTYHGPNPALHNQPCYGCRSPRSGRRVWSGGPGPRNALVWFPHILPVGFVTVPGRTLRKVKEQ